MKVKKVIVGIAQGFLSIAMLGSGIMKLLTPYEELASQMSWAEHVSPFIAILIGLIEVLGALGMNLPFLIKKYKKLVPIAAAGLALTMLGAVVTNILLDENFIAALVLFVIASVVSYSRMPLLKKEVLQTTSL